MVSVVSKGGREAKRDDKLDAGGFMYLAMEWHE